jgi:hypothetical protein
VEIVVPMVVIDIPIWLAIVVGVKDADTALDANVYARYAKLTEAEIKALTVDHKWLAALDAAIHGEMDRVRRQLTQRVKELAERYETPLPQMISRVVACTARSAPPWRDPGAVYAASVFLASFPWRGSGPSPPAMTGRWSTRSSPWSKGHSPPVAAPMFLRLPQSGAISGFHLGEEIDLRGLAFSSSASTLPWKQTTSGAHASGTLTVKEGTSSTTLTLVGSYTSANFSATSDGHGGTLITDPPITNGAVVTNSGTGSDSEGIAGAPGSGTTVYSGGYEFGGDAGPFGGGMAQLDTLLSQFGGVISGFDLGDEIGPHSLGFGSSSSAMSWGADAGAPGVDKGGNTFNLTLLGQYAANFDASADGHGGPLIADPPASSSVDQTALVVHH